MTEYATLDRCQRAKALIESDNARRVAKLEGQARANGGIVADYGNLPNAQCVPA